MRARPAQAVPPHTGVRAPCPRALAGLAPLPRPQARCSRKDPCPRARLSALAPQTTNARHFHPQPGQPPATARKMHARVAVGVQ